MQKRARITSKGQITIPRDIRRALGVRSGDSLLFESDRRGMRVRPMKVESRFEKYRGIGNPGIPSGRKGVVGWVTGVTWKMTTAIDTNVLVALWDQDNALNSVAQSFLDAAFRHGSLVIPAPVYAELMASPDRSETFLDSFLQDTGISVDWNLEEAVWRAAGLAFQHYATRRRKHVIPGRAGFLPIS